MDPDLNTVLEHELKQKALELLQFPNAESHKRAHW